MTGILELVPYREPCVKVPSSDRLTRRVASIGITGATRITIGGHSRFIGVACAAHDSSSI